MIAGAVSKMRMMTSTLVNGGTINFTGKVSIFITMAIFTSGNTKTERDLGKAHISSVQIQSGQAINITEKLTVQIFMAREHTSMLREISSLVSGKIITRLYGVFLPLQTEILMKVTSYKVNSKDMEHTGFLMD